jgi:alkylresorcinol/alkylpyrone synthase
LLTAQRANCVVSVCVEVCSAAFYLDDDPGVLISACLFGDGAAAAVTSSEPGERRIRWRNSESLLNPSDRDYLRFEHRHGMLRNILTKQVPNLAAKAVENLLTTMSNRDDVPPDQIRAWILHAGGREILSALRDRLGLEETDLRWSAGVLREYGNVSSPCVLFALKAALDGAAPPGVWWMSSFGAGFSCHGAFLEVE